MQLDTKDLVGTYEIAERLHITRSLATSWYMQRHSTGHPEAVWEGAMGRLWSWTEVRDWWINWTPKYKNPRRGYLNGQENTSNA